MRFKAVTVGFVLAGTALGSAALTLGRTRGAAWIGQPLDVQVPVQLDSGQTDSALCAEADVFHGEARQDSARVQATPAEGSADTVNLRISTAAPVDEPVVTIYLRAGCGQKTARKYVLLADFPPEPQSTPARLAPQVPTVAPSSAITDASTGTTPTVTAPPSEAKAPAVKAAARLATKMQVKEASKEPAATKKESAPAPKAEKPLAPTAQQSKPSGKARLRLDPVETLAERVKNLEATTTQSSLQEDMTRDAQKMLQLQSDLRTLLDQAVKNEASLAAMRERLEKAEADRIPVAVVYGLIALVAVCVAALAFLWNRRNKPAA